MIDYDARARVAPSATMAPAGHLGHWRRTRGCWRWRWRCRWCRRAVRAYDKSIAFVITLNESRTRARHRDRVAKVNECRPSSRRLSSARAPTTNCGAPVAPDGRAPAPQQSATRPAHWRRARDARTRAADRRPPSAPGATHGRAAANCTHICAPDLVSHGAG